MARSRNLKPGFFKNSKLADCGKRARLLFAGLWCYSDREGRLEDRPRELKAELFPYDDDVSAGDIDTDLTKLSEAKFILRYCVGEDKFIQIINFTKHQNPHVKEHASTIPAPDLSGTSTENSGTSRADSLLPITDSLNPITTLSGKPDVTPLNGKKNGKELKTDAIEVLQFLNEKSGKNYEPVPANIDLIISRFKEGFTPEQMRKVIVRQCREWLTDDKMHKYCRPKTLFNKTNFANYAGELK